MRKSKGEILKDGFQGISDALESDFEMIETTPINREKFELDEFEEIEEGEHDNLQIISKDDEAYIELEIKDAIQGIGNVMNVLEQDLITNSDARKFEVFATLATSKINAINSFRDLKFSKKRISLEERKVQIRTTPKPQTINGDVNNIQVNAGEGDSKKFSFESLKQLVSDLTPKKE